MDDISNEQHDFCGQTLFRKLFVERKLYCVLTPRKMHECGRFRTKKAQQQSSGHLTFLWSIYRFCIVLPKMSFLHFMLHLIKHYSTSETIAMLTKYRSNKYFTFPYNCEVCFSCSENIFTTVNPVLPKISLFWG